MNKSVVLQAAVCLSLSNLLFMGIWSNLFGPEDPQSYFFESAPPRWIYIESLLACYGIGMSFYIIYQRVRQSKNVFIGKTARILFLLLVAFSLNAIRHLVPQLSLTNIVDVIGKTGVVVILIIMLSVSSWMIKHHIDVVAKAAGRLMLIMSPFIVINTIRVISFVITPTDISYKPVVNKRSNLEGNIGDNNVTRVVCIVFDELDQTSIEAMEKTNPLMEFNRLKATSINMNNAFPAGETTWKSIPAMITGRSVSEVEFKGPSTLEIKCNGDSAAIKWNEVTNVFSKAKQRGRISALAGWGHPYCRVIGKDLNKCHWRGYTEPLGRSIRNSLITQGILLLETVPGIGRLTLRQISNAWHTDTFRTIRDEAMKLVTDTRYDLVFIHYPIPHGPYIYDSKREVIEDEGHYTYEDNLKLSDKTLGGIRSIMQKKNLWDNAVVIVTSDHWKRKYHGEKGPNIRSSDHRVPFYLKMPGQDEPIAFGKIFSCVLFHDLVLAIVDGNVRDVDNAVKWLEEKSSLIT